MRATLTMAESQNEARTSTLEENLTRAGELITDAHVALMNATCFLAEADRIVWGLDSTKNHNDGTSTIVHDLEREVSAILTFLSGSGARIRYCLRCFVKRDVAQRRRNDHESP